MAAPQERISPADVGKPPPPAAQAYPPAAAAAVKKAEAQDPDMEIVVGTYVVVEGLKNAPQYNDEPGRVDSFDEETGRFKVHLMRGMTPFQLPGTGKPPKYLAVRRENLKVRPEGGYAITDLNGKKGWYGPYGGGDSQ